MKKFTQTLLVVFITVALFGTANGQTVTNQYYNVTSGNGYGLRFWSSDNYKIHMGNSSYYKYGPVQDYSIKMTMNNDADRGWTWGVLNTAPIAALSTQGTFQLANDLKVLGNTGIGTTSPNSKLHVNASSGQDGLRVQISGSSKFTVASNGGTTIGAFNNAPPANGLYVNGNVGIGNSTPTQKLDVNGNIIIKGTQGFNANGEEAILYLGDGNNFIKSIHGKGVAIGTYCWSQGVDMNTIYVNHCGQVGIGTSEPGGFKLAVDGYIGARGVKVTSSSPFPDYVFENDYTMLSILDLEKFVKEKKHLPNIPSANEIEKEEGIDIGEIQLKLLEKIEEQALYIISLQKQINELSEKVNGFNNN
jgi:hypothetical protein